MAKTDLAERCREILNWRNTGLLRGHALRDLADTLTQFNEDDRIPQAELLTVREALTAVANPPIAWMRRWAFDGVDVMKMRKVDRPRGWMMHAVTTSLLYVDDVPLFTTEKEPANGR